MYTPSGWLLTTRRQFHTWREARRSAVPSTAVEAAMVNAARWGRDSSGRYQAAPFWLAGTQKEQSALPSPQSALMQWTAWEPLVGAANADGLVLVQRLVFEAIGWTLTALIGLLFLALAWRWRRLRLGLLLLWLASPAWDCSGCRPPCREWHGQRFGLVAFARSFGVFGRARGC